MASASRQAEGTPSVPGKILIVDDQAGITKVVSLIAGQAGFETRCVTVSDQATEAFIDFKPDVVILDMIMPGKDGIDVLGEILLTGIPTRFILTSGYGDAYLRLAKGVADFHDAGVVRVMQKPFRREALADLLREVTAGLAGVPASAEACGG